MGCCFTKCTWPSIAERLSAQDPTLTELRLDDQHVKPPGAKLVAEALKSNMTVQVLTLSGNNINDEGTIYLGDMLKTNKVLKELDMCSNWCTEIKPLADAFRINNTLEVVNLGSNPFGDDGAKHLSEGLKKNTSITELHINACWIGSDGARGLGEALQSNNTLKILKANNNAMGDTGATALIAAFKDTGDSPYNTALIDLDVSWNWMDDELLEELKRCTAKNRTVADGRTEVTASNNPKAWSEQLGVSSDYICGDGEFLSDALSKASYVAFLQHQEKNKTGEEPEFPIDPDDPSFLDIADVFAKGDQAYGFSQTCPRDLQPHCSLVDAFWQKFPGRANKATHFLSWVHRANAS